MKVIIAGSRTIDNYDELLIAIKEAPFQITEVISGAANGVDKMGERWALENGIPLQRFPANWNKYGFSAGYMRNVVMAEHAQALLLVWDGQSAGSASMKRIARMKQMPMHEHIVRQDWF
jgi:hypothetical protein